jgi:hypothetical protein
MALFNFSPGEDSSYKELIKQAKVYVPVSTSLNGQTLVGHVKKAIQNYLYKTISREFYLAVDGAADGVYPADLIDMIKRVVFNFAFSTFSASGNLQISNVGFTEAKTSTQDPARLELINNFRNETFDTAMKELDEILYFIETQLLISQEATKYALFTASFAKAKLDELLISTATEFSEYYPINDSRLVFNALRQDLKYLQGAKIKPLLYDLYALVLNSSDADIQDLLTNFIKPALAHLAIARGVQKLTAILGLYGTITIFDNSANNYARTHKTAPLDLLKAYQEAAQQQGEQYLNDMVEFIKNNPATYTDYPHDLPADFDDDDSHALHEHERLFVM